MYYLQHYATTHERVSASDLLRKDASVGLRGVVRTLADILKQGKNVVLDDENWSRETRVSYLKGVQKKVSILTAPEFVFSRQQSPKVVPGAYRERRSLYMLLVVRSQLQAHHGSTLSLRLMEHRSVDSIGRFT